MNRLVLVATLILGGLPSFALWNYPPTRTVDTVDTYFGMKVQDPYRWLENLRDPEVKGWFREQAELTDRVLARIPGRDALVREWAALDRQEPPWCAHIAYARGRVFFTRTRGGENVGRLYYRDGWTGPDHLLFDPAHYQTGVATVIQSVVPSWDGRHVALGLASGGAEYGQVRILDVARGKLLPESISPSFGPIGWTADGSAFFYDAGPVTDLKRMDVKLDRKTLLHRLGTPVAADRDVFSDASCPDLGIAPRELPEAYVSKAFPDCLFGAVSTVQNELRIFYAPSSDLDGPKIHWKVLCRPADNLVRGLALLGGQVYAVSHDQAPRRKVVRTSLAHPDWQHADTVLPEGRDPVLSVTATRDYLFIVKSNGIRGRILKYQPASGRVTELSLPASGTVRLSCPDRQSNHCLVSIGSWLRPAALYDLDGARGTFSLSSFSSGAACPGFENLVAEEVEAPGQDGTPVPLSIIHRKDLVLDGTSNCILHGYGAYGVGTRPGFSIFNAIALHGVVVAYAHPRGGDEKGEAWYRDGFQATKPNTWKDFISCAEYLVKHGYTSPQRLGGTGTSAGGILISRAATERPDLFAAAVCNVGCANAMRLEFSPNGPANIPEFGTVKDPAQCRALLEMDGVQHVRPGVKYPAILGVGGWNDPRVPPWQPGKFVAAVQKASASAKPALMKVNFHGGHFSGEKFATFRDMADQYAFLLWQTGDREFQPAR